MIYTDSNSTFPDQVVPDVEKETWDYGLKVGRAIEGEWFGYARNNRYINNYNNYHNLRLYARGEQSIQKYKDELSINGDLSYLNLDWKPIPVLSKFVDIIVNGMSQRVYDVKAYAQDPASQKARTQYAEAIHRDIATRAYLDAVKQSLGIDISNAQNREQVPESEQELSIHMQLDYKQSIEIAEEEAITNTMARNKYDLTKRRIDYDLTVLGIGAVKTGFNRSEGVTIDYVDPANLVYSYTEDPNFEDIWYVGEVKGISIPELKKEFPYLTETDLEEIQKYTGNENYTRNWNGRRDNNTVQVLYFEYKTYTNQVFKIKHTAQGLEKALEKPDTFNPPANDNFDRVERKIEVLYQGVKCIGNNELIEWKLSENMTRPFADTTKVEMNYAICAPRMYKGRIDSTVSRITGFADMIQITHLKLQQVIARMVPDGVFLDMDGLAEVDLGNGTNYNPAEALNMYFQTGSVVGRSLTQDGELNRGKVPVQELQTGNGQAKIQSLISTYNYYLQMIRDVTGLNEARDGALADKDTLVGLQKIAAQASNIATKHINNASLYITLRICENISKKIADMLNFPLTKNSLKQSITTFNTMTLSEIDKLNLHDFGIFLDMEPDEEAKAQLEQNIQIALSSGGIDLEDAIDIRQIRNLKLANQMLKQKRKRKLARERQMQAEQAQQQSQLNTQSNQAAAEAEVQKQQALTTEKVNFEEAKSQFEIQRMETEAEIKRQLMAEEFNYQLQLEQMKMQRETQKEAEIEDRKDKRTRITGSQQSEMISQRKNNSLPIDFEAQGVVNQIKNTEEYGVQ